MPQCEFPALKMFAEHAMSLEKDESISLYTNDGLHVIAATADENGVICELIDRKTDDIIANEYISNENKQGITDAIARLVGKVI